MNIQEQIERIKEKRNIKLSEVIKPVKLIDENRYYNKNLNDKQNLAVQYAKEGKSFILIGKAGTGKSTTERIIFETLLKNRNYKNHDYKLKGGERRIEPGIALVTYTNTAKNVSKEILYKSEYIKERLNAAITTIHMLLEYSKIKGQGFKPKRNEEFPLSIETLLIDESSLVDINLADKLYKALPEEVQLIVIGDLEQIPPAFGESYLYNLIGKLPIIRLDHIYRQKETNPIITQADRVLNGKAPEQELITLDNKQLGLYIPKTVQMETEKEKEYLDLIALVMAKAYHTGFYDPLEDIILCPYRTKNRLISCHQLNPIIGKLANEGNLIYEIIMGESKVYISVGDIVFINKERGIVTSIEENDQYNGEIPDTPENIKNYLGEKIVDLEEYNFKPGKTIEQLLDEDPEETISRPISHKILIRLLTGDLVELTSTEDINKEELTLGYATTFHKAQGGQWRKTFIILHSCHGKMMNRQMLYTGITRSQELTTIFINNLNLLSFWSNKSFIKGNSWEDRLLWLKDKYSTSDKIETGKFKC